ncbi:uncharacterized protein GBIM_21067 [Gryllus bimaculatus]|nr:uncharacterized protein GBIM_21067 [Gryllus bimaculatus]
MRIDVNSLFFFSELSQSYGQPQPPYPKQEGYPPQPGGYPPTGASAPPPQQGYPYPNYPSPPPPYEGSNPAFAPPAPGFASPQSGMYGTAYGDEPLTHNSGETGPFEFSEKTIRHGFIRKVYSILMLQLLVSLSFIALFTFHNGTKNYVRGHPEMVWIAFVIVLVTLIAMSCCTNVRRKAPMNFIFLFVFTLAESLILGVISSTYNPDAVLMAVGLCAAVCFGLTLFAFQTKWDFTVMGGVLFVAVIILFLFGIVAAILPGSKTLTLVYASLGALVFCVYLVYDTQMMMGGKHKYSISPEEYIFAALSLYLDVINIFLYLLTIIGIARD